MARRRWWLGKGRAARMLVVLDGDFDVATFDLMLNNEDGVMRCSFSSEMGSSGSSMVERTEETTTTQLRC